MSIDFNRALVQSLWKLYDGLRQWRRVCLKKKKKTRVGYSSKNATIACRTMNMDISKLLCTYRRWECERANEWTVCICIEKGVYREEILFFFFFFLRDISVCHAKIELRVFLMITPVKRACEHGLVALYTYAALYIMPWDRDYTPGCFWNRRDSLD